MCLHKNTELDYAVVFGFSLSFLKACACARGGDMASLKAESFGFHLQHSRNYSATWTAQCPVS